MSKELRELLKQLDTMKTEVRSLMGENKIAEAESKMEEVRSLQKKIKLQEEMEGIDNRGGNPVDPPAGNEPRTDEQLEAEYRQVFIKAVRRQRVSVEERSVRDEYIKRAMHQGGVADDEDGDSALIVPQDISTRINEIMRTLNDLSRYIRTETVRTLSGSRVLEKDEDMVPFAVVDEYDPIDETDNPKFVPVTYKLVKRAGILPITNELLRDTDQNLMAYIANWIAKKHVVTKNSLIVPLMNTLSKKALADLKAIKKVLNVDLDPAISLTSTVLTNQDGFNWLDEQVDDNGRFLLQDDITQPGRKLLFGRPVAVAANRYLPSATGTPNKAPLIIGNLAQLAVLFSRGQYEMLSTNVGGDAFKRDTTDLRTITRDDCKLWDDKAAVYGQLSLS